MINIQDNQQQIEINNSNSNKNETNIDNDINISNENKNTNIQNTNNDVNIHNKNEDTNIQNANNNININNENTNTNINNAKKNKNRFGSGDVHARHPAVCRRFRRAAPLAVVAGRDTVVAGIAGAQRRGDSGVGGRDPCLRAHILLCHLPVGHHAGCSIPCPLEA